MNFFEKHRLIISVLLGFVLSLMVVLIWNANNDSMNKSLQNKVQDTNKLIVQQFREALRENINKLENLKHRLEITNGDYFKYWASDASLMVEQDPSFLFVEWIDSNMVIQMVEPYEDNEEAVGLDISGMDFRSPAWHKARSDSVFNLTHWIKLAQGDHAFLVDAPVYIQGNFEGTITAGMDFTRRFNGIMQGLEQYHVVIKDDEGTSFYTYGSPEGIDEFDDLMITDDFRLGDADNSAWAISMVPNALFSQQNIVSSISPNLVLGLLLCMLLAITFFFMQKSSAAEKSAKKANEKLRALIDSAPIAIYVINSRGQVVDLWNHSAERMLGWQKKEVMGEFLPHVPDTHRDNFNYLLKKGIEEGGLINKEITRIRKDGREGIFRLNLGNIVGKDQHMLVLLEDVTKEKETEKKLKKSLAEKNILLAEIHHRVKNNLAIIVGLIELHNDEEDNPQITMMLNETKNRIFSIAEVHELLYRTENFSHVNLAEYIDMLVGRIQKTYDRQDKPVEVKNDLHDFNININQAVPLGLLFNELITNSYKHAFNGVKNPTITLKLDQKDDVIAMSYKDNGTGIPEHLFEEADSLGITLIKTLLMQIEAEYTILSDNGFGIQFQFVANPKGAHGNI